MNNLGISVEGQSNRMYKKYLITIPVNTGKMSLRNYLLIANIPLSPCVSGPNIKKGI